jgi:hypothetical protein
MEELEVIVQRMMDAGEPEDNIRMVIEEFNKGQEVKTSTTTPDAVVEGVEIASPAPSKSLDTSSVSQRLQDNPDDVSAVITSLKNAWNKSKMEASRLGEFWQLGDSDNETTDIASSMLANAIFGSDEIEEYIKKYGKDSFVAAGLGKEELLESIKGRKKQKQEDSLDTETLEVIESFKNGDIIKGVGAVGSAIVGALGSAAYGIGTLGAGYFMDFAAEPNAPTIALPTAPTPFIISPFLKLSITSKVSVSKESSCFCFFLPFILSNNSSFPKPAATKLSLPYFLIYSSISSEPNIALASIDDAISVVSLSLSPNCQNSPSLEASILDLFQAFFKEVITAETSSGLSCNLCETELVSKDFEGAGDAISTPSTTASGVVVDVFTS